MLAASAGLYAVSGFAAAPDSHTQWGAIETYCMECHNSEDWAGKVAMDLLNPPSANCVAARCRLPARKAARTAPK